jgi:hypothetical protein
MASMLCSIAYAQSPIGVEASFALEHTSFILNEPVRIKLIVLNRMSTQAKLSLGRDRKANFAFVLTRPDGSKAVLPPLPEREGMYELGNVSVEPAHRFEQMLMLNEWTTFSQPGRYVIEADLITHIHTESRAVRGPISRHEFDVTARDEVRLHQVCEQLAGQIERSRSVREAREAASALVVIQDPLIVPYVERALASKKYVEAIVLDGLANVADPNAVRVLIAVANESPNWPPDPNTAVGHRSILANRALTRVADTTKDRELGNQVRKAIRQTD